jgi:hypothetical protein
MAYIKEPLNIDLVVAPTRLTEEKANNGKCWSVKQNRYIRLVYTCFEQYLRNSGDLRTARMASKLTVIIY